MWLMKKIVWKVTIIVPAIKKKNPKINKLQHNKQQKEETDISFGSFNHPQFYQLISPNGELSIVPFQSRQHLDYLAAQESKC